MIKLKNVSKFYYSKGVIASGFSKVSLEFKIGEFVAITGESGSGKSTLLNVISGLDSYEEGEMYINGEETSHYIEKDWEDYRRKYIGNIYQSFNLINSYTVYQNIELVLLLNGISKKDAKPRVLELIDKVGLTKFKNTKISKLSGGQRQRVAISRALAKDVPVIIADEPTGNLDKSSASSIIKLLSEVAKDRLVIIVTHNYKEVEPYVTRKITMHDGKVLEDKRLRPFEEGKPKENNYKNISFFNRIRLGFRNTFNIVPKFLLLFLVYMFLVVALVGEYSSFRKEEYQYAKQGENYIFSDTNINRIVIKKNDGSMITDDDYEEIKKLPNIDYIIKDDILVDSYFGFPSVDDYLRISGSVKDISLFTGNVDIGRLPENDNEIIIKGSRDDYYLSDNYDSLLNTEFKTNENFNTVNSEKVKVVGIKYYEDNGYRDYEIYVSNKIINILKYDVYSRNNNLKVNFMGKNYNSYIYSNNFRVVPSSNVARGEAYIDETYNYYCDKNNCLNKTFDISIKNIYYEDKITLNISRTYNRKNIESQLGIGKITDDEYQESYAGSIFINKEEYYELFDKGNYQSSVYVKNYQEIDEVISSLAKANYKTLALKDVLVNGGSYQALRIIKTIVTVVFVFTLFFITYFIIKLILKSRNIYFSTVRMLGGSKKIERQLLIIELLTVTNIAYFLFLLVGVLNYYNVFNIELLNTVNNYFTINDYVLMYVVLTLMSVLISEKYAAKLFKSSALTAYREEV